MGYYTEYDLFWEPPSDEVEAAVNSDEDIRYALEESAKWYEHEADMKTLSKSFPNTLFTLKGQGEELGDYWVKYFKDGKMQYERATLAAFDEQELK